jgi:hypothetical protein
MWDPIRAVRRAGRRRVSDAPPSREEAIAHAESRIFSGLMLMRR